MADFTISISNSIRVFGGEPPTTWNNFNWGTGKWAHSTNDMIHAIGKHLGNSLSITSEIYKSAAKHLANSITLGSETIDQYLVDPAGYNYVFPGQVTDADDRDLATWSDVSRTAASFTTASQPSTSWSEV